MPYGLPRECLAGIGLPNSLEEEYGDAEPPDAPIMDRNEEISRIINDYGDDFAWRGGPESDYCDEFMDMIIDRGRGPELVGTRITIYAIMDYLRHSYSVEEIMETLGLTGIQVRAALDYIDQHHAEVESQFKLISERAAQANAPWINDRRAKTVDELRQRIMGRRAGKVAHDHRRGQ